MERIGENKRFQQRKILMDRRNEKMAKIERKYQTKRNRVYGHGSRLVEEAKLSTATGYVRSPEDNPTCAADHEIASKERLVQRGTAIENRLNANAGD
jgi:hypothetical protein